MRAKTLAPQSESTRPPSPIARRRHTLPSPQRPSLRAALRRPFPFFPTLQAAKAPRRACKAGAVATGMPTGRRAAPAGSLVGA
jgi:hypothetical protein